MNRIAAMKENLGTHESTPKTRKINELSKELSIEKKRTITIQAEHGEVLSEMDRQFDAYVTEHNAKANRKLKEITKRHQAKLTKREEELTANIRSLEAAHAAESAEHREQRAAAEARAAAAEAGRARVDAELRIALNKLESARKQIGTDAESARSELGDLIMKRAEAERRAEGLAAELAQSKEQCAELEAHAARAVAAAAAAVAAAAQQESGTGKADGARADRAEARCRALEARIERLNAHVQALSDLPPKRCLRDLLCPWSRATRVRAHQAKVRRAASLAAGGARVAPSPAAPTAVAPAVPARPYRYEAQI
jgi:chromosome segregation ATPase